MLEGTDLEVNYGSRTTAQDGIFLSGKGRGDTSSVRVRVWGMNCIKFNVYISNMSIASNMPSCMHNMPSCMHNLPSCMHNMPKLTLLSTKCSVTGHKLTFSGEDYQLILAIMHAQLVLHQHAVHHACTTCFLPCATCPIAVCILSLQYGSTCTAMPTCATVKIGPALS